MVSQSFSLDAGMTYNQFNHFVQQAEDQISSIIFEIHSNNLLYSNREDMEEIDEEEPDNSDSQPVIIH